MSPGTVQASPVTTQRTLTPRRQDQGRMRSSIACVWCRRSKVKCENNGPGHACRGCTNNNRQCVYSDSSANSGTARRPSVATTRERPEGGESRPKRPKKSHTSVSSEKELSGGLHEALDPRVLNPDVWKKLYEIYKLHYSTDLPFLLSPKFHEALSQPSLLFSSVDDSEKPSVELLLAFLALTVKFDDPLVHRMSSILSIDPANSVLGVADYYAEAARVKLGGQTAEPLTNMTDKRTRTKLLQRTQAELMLALHDWGMGRGNQAYKGLGSAIDSADVLGLSSGPQNPLPARYQEEDRHLMQAYQQRLCPTRFGEEGEEDYVQAEVERRTFWACFVMDCYLGGAQQRRSKIDKEKIPIQLPMSDQSFAFGKNVKTKLLGESRAEFDARYNAELRQHQLLQERKPINEDRTSDMRKNAMQFTSAKGPLIEIEESEGYHAHWIRAVCVFGKVLAWSCRGGRRTGNADDISAPWDERSRFRQLEIELETFQESLPPDWIYSEGNTSGHKRVGSTTPYVLINVARLLCSVMLHREYLPFIPVSVDKPQGPLDEPTFHADERTPHENAHYWEDSARKCFRAARDIVDLLEACTKANVLPETPLVAFGSWQTAFVGLYSRTFPQMDQNRLMSTSYRQKEEPMERSATIVKFMNKRLKVAQNWCDLIQKMGGLLMTIRHSYEKKMNLGHHTGGGLDLYIGLEQLLKDLDPNITDADPDGSSLQPYSRTRDSSEATSHNSKEEEGAEKDRKVDAASTLSPNPPVETWNAVNREVTQPMPNAEAGSGRSNSFTNRLGQNLLNPDPTSESSSAVHVEDSAQDALANTQHEQNGSLSFPPMWDPFLNWDASWEGHDSNAFADGINVHQLSGYLQSAYMHWPSIAAQAVGS